MLHDPEVLWILQIPLRPLLQLLNHLKLDNIVIWSRVRGLFLNPIFGPKYIHLEIGNF